MSYRLVYFSLEWCPARSELHTDLNLLKEGEFFSLYYLKRAKLVIYTFIVKTIQLLFFIQKSILNAILLVLIEN